jgi:hypothetical protein
VSDIVRRAQLQELAQIVDHLAWPIGKAGEAAVSGSEQTPDKTKEKEGGDRVTRRDVPAQPPRRRDQLGDERNEYGADQEPVEQPCGQVPHPDRTRDVLGIRDRARSAIRIPTKSRRIMKPPFARPASASSTMQLQRSQTINEAS